MLYALMVLAVLAGVAANRIAGLGFALIVAPALILLLGPFEGVFLVNICGTISAALVVTRVWRHIDWRKFAMLTVPSLVTIVPGIWVSVRYAGPGLQIGIGAFLIVALTVSLIVRRSYRRVNPKPSAVISGATAGFTAATAGVGGPPVSVHAVITRWDQRSFAATLQPYFVVTGIATVAGKIIASPGGLPSYEWWLWAVLVVSMVAGLGLGELLSRWVSASAARVTVIALAYLGAALAVVEGVRGLG